jgi:hypothetical protein
MHVGSGIGYEIAMIMYLLNFTYVQQIHRLYSCSYEAMLAIVSLYYLEKITTKFDLNLVLLVALQSLSFVIRNTSPIGWVPVLLCNMMFLGPKIMIWNYLKSFVLIFVPILGVATALDSYYYAKFTFVPWNFIKVNVIEGLSASFGADPMETYIIHEIPKRLNIFLPCFVLGLIHHYRVTRSKGRYPYLVVFCVSIVGIFSLISHKEPKFLLPVFPAFFIFIAQYLQDKWTKSNPRLVISYVILGLLIETAVNVYFVHWHELGAFGPIKYIKTVYPDYNSLATSNMFEGNYLTLNHNKNGPQPSLIFPDYDPPFVAYKN